MVEDTRWAKILVVGLVMAALILSIFTLVPLAQGYGASLSYGEGANMDALANLTQAREDLYKTLPDVFAQGGSAMVQLALALAVIFLGGAVGLLLVAISFNLGVKGYVGVIQAKHDIEAGPKIRTIPRKSAQLHSGSKPGGHIGSNHWLIPDSCGEENKLRYHPSGRIGDARSANGSGLPNPSSDNAELPTFSEIFSPGSRAAD